MNDRSILYEPTMKTQSESAITIIEDRNGKLASLKTVYASMLEESELQGEAAAAIKANKNRAKG